MNWYAIHTRSNCEKRVSSILTETGIENYLPSFREVHQWKDRKQVVDVPVFPGYLFLRFEDSRTARLMIARTDGVVRILGPGEKIEAIPDEQIEAIRTLIKSELPCSSHPFLKIGQRVRVRSGSLDGLEGVLLSRNGDNTLVISVDAIQRSLSVRVNGYEIEAV